MTVGERRRSISHIPTKISFYDKAHQKIISLIHDKLLGSFIDPGKQLRAAGLRSGQMVLEVGPGPGFFTLPAAEIIGRGGRLYSFDISLAAVKKLSDKVEGKGLLNVSVMLRDVTKTGLSDSSIDVAFLFGVIHDLKDLESALRELHRILRHGGTLSVQSRWSENKLLNSVTKSGLFRLVGKDSRVYRFVKND